MLVIYHCHGGAHASVVCAAVHLGLLPADRVPTADELWAVRWFGREEPADHGRIRCMGVDSRGTKVCVLGRRNVFRVLRRAVEVVAREMGVWAPGEVLFVDTLPCANWYMRVGALLSRAAGLRRLGRPLVVHGTRKAYPELVALVRRTLAGMEGRPEGG